MSSPSHCCCCCCFCYWWWWWWGVRPCPNLVYVSSLRLVEDICAHTNFERVPVTWLHQDKRPNNPRHTETLNVSYLHIAYILVSNSTVIMTCICDTSLVHTHWIIHSHCNTERTTGTTLWCWDQSNRVLFLSGYVMFYLMTCHIGSA